LKRLRVIKGVKKLQNKRVLVLLALFTLIISPLISAESIDVTLLNQDPDPVSAGDVVEVRFKIDNLWQTTKDPVKLEIIPEYPFSLYSGSREKNLGIMLGKQTGADSRIVDYKLKVDENAVEGDTEIKIKASMGDTVWIYKDEFFIDIEKEELRLRTYIRSSNLITPGSKGKVSLELANAGGYDINFLELTLLPSEDYKLLSTSNYAYIGDLDSDDTESEEFLIYVNEGADKVSIPIKILYEANDYPYTSEETLTLKLLTPEEAKSIGLIKVSYTPYIWAGIIIGIALLLIFRKLKKK
jgi:hypothetical protein